MSLFQFSALVFQLFLLKHLPLEKVTIRDRDTMQQERVAISDLGRIVSEKVDLRGLLRKL